MDNKQLIKELNDAYEALQNLGIQPTKSNLTIILQALNALQSAYKCICTLPKEEDGNGSDN